MPGEPLVQLVNAPLGKVETADNQLVAVSEERASVVTIGLQGPPGQDGDDGDAMDWTTIDW